MLSHDAPPGSSAEDGPLGGESILVDGFIVADRIRKFSPELYETLCEVPVAWHASGNADASITPDKLYPVIEREGPSTWPYRIRWNNDDRGVVPLEHADKWYQAARKWALMVQSPKHQYRFQLRPGSVLSMSHPNPYVTNVKLTPPKSLITGVFSMEEPLSRACGGYVAHTVSNVPVLHEAYNLHVTKSTATISIRDGKFPALGKIQGCSSDTTTFKYPRTPSLPPGALDAKVEAFGPWSRHPAKKQALRNSPLTQNLPGSRNMKFSAMQTRPKRPMRFKRPMSPKRPVVYSQPFLPLITSIYNKIYTKIIKMKVWDPRHRCASTRVLPGVFPGAAQLRP